MRCTIKTNSNTGCASNAIGAGGSRYTCYAGRTSYAAISCGAVYALNTLLSLYTRGTRGACRPCCANTGSSRYTGRSALPGNARYTWWASNSSSARRTLRTYWTCFSSRAFGACVALWTFGAYGASLTRLASWTFRAAGPLGSAHANRPCGARGASCAGTGCTSLTNSTSGARRPGRSS